MQEVCGRKEEGVVATEKWQKREIEATPKSRTKFVIE